MKAAAPAPAPAAPRLWDIFCHVIDNWGDLGVCWRLARQLVAHGQRVRLWVDDASALVWMAHPGALQGPSPCPTSHGCSPSQTRISQNSPSPSPQPLYQGLGVLAGLSVHHWPRLQPEAAPPTLEPGDVLIEAFGCDIAPHWVQALQPEGRAGRVWLNLEYLSAEPWIERCHGLPSPVLSGPLAGRLKWFYYPGFTPGSGGLLGPDRTSAPDTHTPATPIPGAQTTPSPAKIGPASGAAPVPDANHPQLHHTPSTPRITLFCYEPEALGQLLAQPALAQAHWRVCAGRSLVAWQQAQAALPASATVELLALQPQTEFDALLRSSSLNLVRGEDSLVSALWAGQPLVWQLYPQDDGAHHAKLKAFLDWLEAPPCLRQWHRAWNGAEAATVELPPLTAQRLQRWRHCTLQARQRLSQQGDLLGQLLRFVAGKR